MASHSTKQARDQAYIIVKRWLKTGDFPERLIGPQASHRGLLMEMVLGCVRNRGQLDFIIDRYSSREPAVSIRSLLYVGIYELLFINKSKDYATVNETVNLAKKELSPGTSNYVNAILRKVVSAQDDWETAYAEAPLFQRLNHPQELVVRWLALWGEEKTIALCHWNNQRPSTSIRVNLKRCSLAELMVRLTEAGLEAQPHPAQPEQFLRLASGARIPELPGFIEGLFYVQDPATWQAPALLNAQPGERVWDACAAPGGKSVVIAEQMEEQGCLVLTDLHDDRLCQLDDNLNRMQQAWPEIIQADAARLPEEVIAEFKEWAPWGFDAILLDVPCTNTGVLQRRPDARWRFDESRLAALEMVQNQLLDTAARLIKKDTGRIIYSTCSIEPEENGQRVAKWLETHLDFELVEEQQIFPGERETDGAYTALIRCVNESEDDNKSEDSAPPV